MQKELYKELYQARLTAIYDHDIDDSTRELQIIKLEIMLQEMKSNERETILENYPDLIDVIENGALPTEEQQQRLKDYVSELAEHTEKWDNIESENNRLQKDYEVQKLLEDYKGTVTNNTLSDQERANAQASIELEVMEIYLDKHAELKDKYEDIEELKEKIAHEGHKPTPEESEKMQEALRAEEVLRIMEQGTWEKIDTFKEHNANTVANQAAREKPENHAEANIQHTPNSTMMPN